MRVHRYAPDKTLTAAGDLCCPHAGADHEGFPERPGKPLGLCAVPECKCAGWKSRQRKQKSRSKFVSRVCAVCQKKTPLDSLNRPREVCSDACLRKRHASVALRNLFARRDRMRLAEKEAFARSCARSKRTQSEHAKDRSTYVCDGEPGCGKKRRAVGQTIPKCCDYPMRLLP